MNKNFYTPLQIETFLKNILMTCEQFNLSISHEDKHGGFLIKPWNEEDHHWLDEARFVNQDINN